MSNRIVPLLVTVSIVIALSGSAGADVGVDDDLNLEGPIIAVCAVYSFTSLMLTMYNGSRLKADDPSKGGGAAGLVVGSFTVLVGVTALIIEDPAVRAAGVVTAGVGVYAVNMSLRNLGAVRRKFIEEEERGLSLSPILIEDGTGKLAPGMQVSWTF